MCASVRKAELIKYVTLIYLIKDLYSHFIAMVITYTYRGTKVYFLAIATVSLQL